MVTFLSGGTGTPKLLDGAGAVFSPDETTVVVNTGDDIELGSLFISPDIDTLIFQGGGVLDRDRWWGIAGDTYQTHSALEDLTEAAGLPATPQYLEDSKQTAGREISRWRRFAGTPEFMQIGDRDRAIHLTRTSLLDLGYPLSEVTAMLADAFGLEVDILPVSDDPIASLIHGNGGFMHFQEYWVAHGGEPTVSNVEFRGSSRAEPAPGVLEALDDVVVIGPSNPVTSLGPMLSIPGFRDALTETPVVAVSPFIGDTVFSGPAAELMEAVGATPNTQGMAAAYPFADVFILDENDETELDRPVIRTDITLETKRDATRVMEAVADGIERVT